MSQLARTTSATAPLTPVSRASAPSTPSAQKVQEQATPGGTWKHPKFDEITRRQYATTFDERNVKIILANAALLLSSFVAPSVAAQVAVLRSLVAKPLSALLSTIPYSEWVFFAIRFILLANIAVQLLPLVRRYYPDEIADIPLTPSQRLAMGLKTDVPTPQTPGSTYASPNYVTPPRYQKSTPRSSFSNQGDRASHSPLSGSPRGGLANSTSNSPFAANVGSPLFQKAMGGSAQKRLSYGGTPLSNSFFGDSSSSATPGTPTPGTGKASVGLTNRYLYEKKRDSPRSNLFK
ncbi:hypothetical protein K458DRAFT_403630 [Lentithecium fluviatile CBS 122367]|uniref:Nuclear pore complex component n=1 Tax=Lentithecium fluviatile CBS 122367 TaxID=1168545 RepID=A0A6G1J5I9_9PLEO|nr:hypothetical protein K458DRAFT_403630 [Lentithecium fluviatile CBS 122367]